MSHTPGPWIIKGPREIGENHVNDNGSIVGCVYNDYAIEFGEGGPGTIIAEVFGRCAETTFPDSEANARLITAAPDMLDALEKILAYYDPAVHPVVPVSELRSMVKATIAKAKGE